MRLVTKLHDYYDGPARNTVSDKTHTFVREQYDVENIDTELIRVQVTEDRTYRYSIYSEIVGFCGEIYPCVRVEKEHKEEYTTKVFYAYTWDALIKIVSAKTINTGWTRNRIYVFGSKEATIRKWLEFGRTSMGWYDKTAYEAKNDPKLKKIFADEKIAYFHINTITKKGNPMMHVYPVLKDLEFYKLFDPYTCFQTIEYYLTNELVKPDEISQEIQDTITDELKAQAHGYNRFSFRKESSKK